MQAFFHADSHIAVSLMPEEYFSIASPAHQPVIEGQ
jgi:hypothetical protein